MRTPGLTGAVLGVAAVFGLSWIAAIAYWRLGTRVPGPAEIGGLMLGVPATLAGVMSWWRRSTPRAADASAAPLQAAEERIPDPSVPTRSKIVSAALELPLGNAAADVLAQAGDGAGLALHPRLRDPQGFGVLAAEVPGLDTGTLEAELAALNDASIHVRAELARALSLAEPVLDQLLGEGLPLPVSGGLLLPADWSDAERELARRWLAQRIARAAPDLARNLAMFAVASGQHLFGLLRAQGPRVGDAPEGATLWLAVASNIGAATIDRWARRGRLLSARQANGQAPGEAAAGVVIDASACDGGGTSVHFPDPPSASPASAHGAGLAARFGEAMSMTATGSDDIGLVVSDFDHLPARCTQLAAAVSAQLPRLDPARNVLRLGQSCGNAGAVLALAALVLGAHAANEAGHASLVVAGGDQHGPALALVKPPASTP